MDKKNIGFIVIALLVGYGAGYFTHSSTTTIPTRENGRAAFMGGARSGANGGGFLSGTVVAKDTGSITLNTRDGSSRVVLITPSTSVSKSMSGALTDVTVGASIIISGTTNSDGSVSASLIQLRPSTPPANPQVQ